MPISENISSKCLEFQQPKKALSFRIEEKTDQ